jgi:hypothetical protein
MEADKITLFILDDNIPKIPEFVEQSLYDEKISAASLSQLLDSAEWTGQHNLKQLTSFIIESDHFKSGNIEVWGFTHPSLCLDSIDEGLLPNVIIYDWEYGSETNKESSNWLKEILNSTQAFVFVYSMVRNEIPPFLNKSEFDEFSDRFQLFLKGDIKSSVFSSEEFIHQYIVSTISKSNRIKLQGLDISFEENGYLSAPSDILYLEKILGRLSLKEKLAAGIKSISDQSIEQLLEGINIEIHLDDEKNLLVAADSNLMIKKIKSSRVLMAIDVLKEFGLQSLREVLEVGVAKAE